jgi:hypothetical protein
LTGKAHHFGGFYRDTKKAEGFEKKRHVPEANVFIWSEDKKIITKYHAINPLEGTVSLDKIGKGIPDEW